MMAVTMEELSMIALYRQGSRSDTQNVMYAVPVTLISPELQEMFRSARRKVREMSDEEFDALDFRDALIADTDADEEDGESDGG